MATPAINDGLLNLADGLNPSISLVPLYTHSRVVTETSLQTRQPVNPGPIGSAPRANRTGAKESL